MNRKNLSLIVAGFSLAAGLLLAPVDAAACSCVPMDPWRAFARADAAIIGVFQGKRSPTTYVFRVERSYKAALPDEVEVESAEHGASCGIEAVAGTRLGLFLARDEGRWASNLCSQTTAERMRVAAAGLPRPNGRGSIRLLVGGSFGPARVQALDAAGRTLAYGNGRGVAVAISTCRGGERFVELATDREGHAWVGIRELRTLRLLKEVPIRISRFEHPARVHCLGGDVYASVVAGDVGRLVRVRGRSARTLRRGLRSAPAFSGRFAYVADRDSIDAVDLLSGRGRLLANVQATQLAVRPDRAWLAAVEGDQLVLVRLGASPRVFRAPPLSADDFPRLVWAGRVLVVLNAGGRVYDTNLRLLGRLPSWYVADVVARGDRLIGVAAGTLSSMRLPRGPLRRIRNLISGETHALAAVNGGPRIRAATLACRR